MQEEEKDDDKIIDFVHEKEIIENRRYYQVYASKEELSGLNYEMTVGRKQLSKLKRVGHGILKQHKKHKAYAKKFCAASAASCGVGSACVVMGTYSLAHGNIFSGVACVVGGAFALAMGAIAGCFAKKYFSLSKQEAIKFLECQNDIQDLNLYLQGVKEEIEICKEYL